MSITDPSQEYFKDGGWHWTGSEWIKGGLAFEYASQVCGKVGNVDADAGDNSLVGLQVPEGYIWVITALAAFNDTNGVSGVRLGGRFGGARSWVAMTGALAAKVGFSWSGTVCLVEGDNPEALLAGCTAGDDLWFYYFGYAMKVT